MHYQNTALENSKINTAASSPLDMLSLRLDEDMRAVNALILQNMQSDVALIPRLAQYLIAAGGKRIRPLLTLAATSLYCGDMQKSYHLAAAVEFIHTATLLHDDVVDESNERRGQESANLIFGNKASVLVGDFLFSKAFQMMVESESLRILRILADAAAIIAQGEVLQLSTTNDINTSLPSYMTVIESKTAALFAAACEIGPILGGADEAQITLMRDYGMSIGTAFQIADDALDYAADQTILGKEIGDDFKEGKMTAPVIFALQNASVQERDFWQRTLGEKDQKPDDFNHALEIITKHHGLEKSMMLAQDYAARAHQCLEKAPRNEITQTLSALADYTVHRKY